MVNPRASERTNESVAAADSRASHWRLAYRAPFQGDTMWSCTCAACCCACFSGDASARRRLVRSCSRANSANKSEPATSGTTAGSVPRGIRQLALVALEAVVEAAADLDGVVVVAVDIASGIVRIACSVSYVLLFVVCGLDEVVCLDCGVFENEQERTRAKACMRCAHKTTSLVPPDNELFLVVTQVYVACCCCSLLLILRCRVSLNLCESGSQKQLINSNPAQAQSLSIAASTCHDTASNELDVYRAVTLGVAAQRCACAHRRVRVCNYECHRFSSA